MQSIKMHLKKSDRQLSLLSYYSTDKVALLNVLGSEKKLYKPEPSANLNFFTVDAILLSNFNLLTLKIRKT